MTNKEIYAEIMNLSNYLHAICYDGKSQCATPKQASMAIIKTVSEILDYVIQIKED